MKIKLNNVRISFPALFKPKGFQGDDSNAKYSAVFALDKTDNAGDIKRLKSGIRDVIQEKWGERKPKNVKHCLHEAVEKEEFYEDPENTMYITSSSTRRPPVVDRDPSQVIYEDDDAVWPGCYVNASVRLWAQDNKFGKRINAELLAVQTLRDGERWGGGEPVDPEEEFSNQSDDDYDDLL